MSALAVTPLPTAKLRNILFTTDFSDDSMQALPYVSGLAAKLGSSVCLCHIVTPNPLVAGAPEVAPSLYEGMKEQAAAQLTALAHSAELARFGPKTLVGSGPIDDELCNIIRENRIDLVVAGTHGRSGIRKLLLGSVVEEICRVATCPVLTVGPGLAPRNEMKFSRIIFPTDLSEDSKRVVPYLRRIAEEYKAEITVLHVMPETGHESRCCQTGGADPPEHDAHVRGRTGRFQTGVHGWFWRDGGDGVAHRARQEGRHDRYGRSQRILSQRATEVECGLSDHRRRALPGSHVAIGGDYDEHCNQSCTAGL